MAEQNNDTLKTIENYLFLAVLFLLPLTVLPTFSNAFLIPKIALMTFGVGAILILKSIRVITTNKLAISSGNYDLPIVLLGATYLASSILQTPNKMEAYFLPGTATVIIAGVFIYFLLLQLDDKFKKYAKLSLFLSGVVFSIITLLATAGVFRSIPQLPLFMQANAFNTLGGALPGLIFLVIVAPLGVNYVVAGADMAKRAFFGVALSILVLASLINLLNVLPGKTTSPQLPGFATSWTIAIDALKVNPLVGIGPGNYLTAFNRFRPIAYNQTDLWSVRFTSGQSYFFTAVTETGLAGAAAILILLYTIYNAVRENNKHKRLVGWGHTEYSTLISLVLMALALLLFPADPALLIIFMALLALTSKISQANIGGFSTGDAQSASKLPTLIVVIPVVVGVLVYGYYASRVLAADITYRNALMFIAQNDGRSAYTTLQQAITTNPYVDRYHVSYAQVNLALANAIAQNEQISDEDRNTIAQLIQQAIREGKAAVALNPQRAGNWEILASIYRAVMPLAQGADAFAVETYNQAIALDPYNTNTRIALGGIYYGAKAYENAIDIFKLAVASKPDHANARFNLAAAYRENGNTQAAIEQMSLVLALVDENSDDFNLAKQTIEDLENKRQAEIDAQGSTNLTPPQQQEQVLEPPLELPEDAQPPESTEPSPSPSATATPTATPTESPTTDASPSPTPSATPAP